MSLVNGAFGRMVEDVLEADAVGAVLRALMDWQGTTAELLTKIAPDGTRPWGPRCVSMK